MSAYYEFLLENVQNIIHQRRLICTIIGNKVKNI